MIKTNQAIPGNLDEVLCHAVGWEAVAQPMLAWKKGCEERCEGNDDHLIIRGGEDVDMM